MEPEKFDGILAKAGEMGGRISSASSGGNKLYLGTGPKSQMIDISGLSAKQREQLLKVVPQKVTKREEQRQRGEARRQRAEENKKAKAERKAAREAKKAEKAGGTTETTTTTTTPPAGGGETKPRRTRTPRTPKTP